MKRDAWTYLVTIDDVAVAVCHGERQLGIWVAVNHDLTFEVTPI